MAHHGKVQFLQKDLEILEDDLTRIHTVYLA